MKELIQRLFSDTPKFFRRMQVFGLSLVGLGTSLSQINGVSQSVVASLITAGSVITAVSQFACKNTDNIGK